MPKIQYKEELEMLVDNYDEAINFLKESEE